MADLLMVGSVAYDTVETPHGRVEQALGGAASYASVAASYFAPARIVAVVGEDFNPAHLAFFRSRGVDLEGLQQVAGQTFHWSGRYEANMNERTTLLTELNVFETFDPILPASYRASEYVLLANIHPGLQLRVLEQMSRPRFVALDTMNLWIQIERDLLCEVIKQVDLILLNDEEAAMLTEESNYLTAAKALLELGPRAAVIKKGEHGAMMVTADGIFSLPGFPVETVTDPTGCGDCFAGGLIGYLAGCNRSDDAALRQAMVYGSVVASFNVEDFSLDRLRRLEADEVAARYRDYRRLVWFDDSTS
ncbi:MAG: sugar kinase [Armatimonadetes bacterium]|nr:sugar kinase [Armatimonadota bacterium]